MSYEITVLYPKPKEETPEILAARTELAPAKIDLQSLKTELQSLIRVLDDVQSEEAKYTVDEVKLAVGIVEDSQGNLRVGIAAGLPSIFGVKTTTEFGERTSQNQLFEITLRRK